MIAESTPFGGIYQQDFRKDNGVWELWFQPVLDLIEEYNDVVAMWSYINCNWDTQPMWTGVGFGDSRLSQSSHVMNQWYHHVIDNPKFVTRLSCITKQNRHTKNSFNNRHKSWSKGHATVDVTNNPDWVRIHSIPFQTIWIWSLLVVVVVHLSRRQRQLEDAVSSPVDIRNTLSYGSISEQC